MHRVELKDYLIVFLLYHFYVFLMHRVELKGNVAVIICLAPLLFLMHRVELKDSLFLFTSTSNSVCS